jgi:acyl-CoA thioester hydrolase
MKSNPVGEFELQIAILPEDIDEQGHVNNVVYVRWIQEVATAHWRTAAPAPDQAKLGWVVVRHEIDYKRQAFLHDQIIARTWIGTAARRAFDRHTEILRASDRKVLAVSRTVWCPIDLATGKPTDVSDDVRGRFSVHTPEKGPGRM